MYLQPILFLSLLGALASALPIDLSTPGLIERDLSKQGMALVNTLPTEPRSIPEIHKRGQPKKGDKKKAEKAAQEALKPANRKWTCRYEGRSTATFTEELALKVIKDAGTIAGKSGDPHKYENGDNLQFLPACHGASFLEFPIFEGTKQWDKKKLTFDQPHHDDAGHYRVVYRNDNQEFCGIMQHIKTPTGETGTRFGLCTGP